MRYHKNRYPLLLICSRLSKLTQCKEEISSLMKAGWFTLTPKNTPDDISGGEAF